MFIMARIQIILFLILGMCAQAYAGDSAGKIAVVNGEVRIISSKPGDKGRITKPGDAIANDDTIQTASGASAKVLFSDQSMIDVGSNSSFKVSDYALKAGEDRTGTFSLLYGKIRSLITKKVGPQGKVEYRAGGAVMGVRGTEFVVDAPKIDAAAGEAGGFSPPSIVVVSGLVQVALLAGGPPIVLKPGDMVVAPLGPAPGAQPPAGGAPVAELQVTRVSGDQMQSIVQGAKSEDRTFVAAVTIQAGPQGAAGPGGPGLLAMNAVGAIVSGAMKEQNVKQEGDVIRRAPPQEFQRGPMQVPPVNIIPGGLVHLSVKVE
ncbi:MAG: FecR domain-containing protein [Deltaproteobacteria bacterium]|nr:FecR domain-containing protein [Deltaproteobacteria bacterium]